MIPGTVVQGGKVVIASMSGEIWLLDKEHKHIFKAVKPLIPTDEVDWSLVPDDKYQIEVEILPKQWRLHVKTGFSSDKVQTDGQVWYNQNKVRLPLSVDFNEVLPSGNYECSDNSIVYYVGRTKTGLFVFEDDDNIGRYDSTGKALDIEFSHIRRKLV